MTSALLTERRRLLILQLLQQDPNYSINDRLLHTLLSQAGQGALLAVVRNDLAWLEDMELLATNELYDCTVAVLRSEGVDVALGLAHVQGVARPRPVA